jgi:hypothetical protein
MPENDIIGNPCPGPSTMRKRGCGACGYPDMIGPAARKELAGPAFSVLSFSRSRRSLSGVFNPSVTSHADHMLDHILVKSAGFL